MQSGSESDPADRSMAARCVVPRTSNATIAAGGVIQRTRKQGQEGDPDDPGGPGGFGSQADYYNSTPSPWGQYKGTQNQYGQPLPIPPGDGSESNGLADGFVRRIIASGFRDMKKSNSESERKIFYKVHRASYSRN